MSRHKSYILAILGVEEVNVRWALDNLKRQPPDIGSAIFYIEKALGYNEFAKNATIKTIDHLETMSEDIREAYTEIVEMTEKTIEIIDRKRIN